MIGQTLDGRYQVLESLGAGGFGQTYIAADTRRPGNPRCVVKVLQPASSDPDFLKVARRLFHSEAETLEKLGHHAHIPRLLAFFEQDQDFFLVQELIEGTPLTQELVPGKHWSESQVRSLLSEVLVILGFIHSQGVIHRDIKPENILRQQADQKLFLVDFGSVKQVRNQELVTDPATKISVIVGTPGYMASEQSQGKPRPNSDLYSLGIIGIQALTGQQPSQFQEDVDGELIWRDQAEVGEELAQVLTQMVRPYFKLRYQTAAEALQALQPSGQHDVVTPTPPSLTSPPLGQPTATEYTQIEPTQVATPLAPPASHVPAASPRPQAPAAKKPKEPPGYVAWLLGLGAMVTVIGLGLVGLTYWGVLPKQFLPSLRPEAKVDNGATLLEQARQEAKETGDLEVAISLALQIPSDSASAETAQANIQQWQTQWQQQQDLFNQAQAAFDTERWYTARDLAFKLPQNPYWDKRADPIYFTAKRKIAELERPKPTPIPTTPPPKAPSEATGEDSSDSSTDDSNQPTDPSQPTDSKKSTDSQKPKDTKQKAPTPKPKPPPLKSPVIIPVPKPTAPPVSKPTIPSIPKPTTPPFIRPKPVQPNPLDETR